MKNTRMKSVIPPILSQDFLGLRKKVIEACQRTQDGLLKINSGFYPRVMTVLSMTIGDIGRGNLASAAWFIDSHIKRDKGYIFHATLSTKQYWFWPDDPIIARITDGNKGESVSLLDAIVTFAAVPSYRDFTRIYSERIFMGMFMKGLFGPTTPRAAEIFRNYPSIVAAEKRAAAQNTKVMHEAIHAFGDFLELAEPCLRPVTKTASGGCPTVYAAC